MKKIMKITLITAGILTGLGLICFLIGAAGVGFDYTKFGKSTEYEMKTFEYDGNVNSVNLSTWTDDIKFEKSKDSKTRVVYYNSKDEKITYRIEAKSQLDIKQEDNRQWYERLSFFSFENSRSLTIYLPEDHYETINAVCTSGNITSTVKLTASGNLQVKSVSGNILLENISCGGKCTAESTSGNISLNHMSSKYDLSLHTTSGSIKLDECSAGNSINCASTSDYISLKNCTAAVISGNSVSGNINIKNVKASSNSEFNTTSGELVFDGTDSPVIHARSISGDIFGRIGYAGQYHTSTVSGSVTIPSSGGDRNYSMETVSGDIRISD